MATKMSKAMYGKTMMKSGGAKKLVKKNMGGPGSGMGSMYKNDQDFETKMATPATKPMLDPVVAAKLQEAAANRRNAVQSETMNGAKNASMQSMSPIKKNGGTKTSYKTGGMVNSNSKITASKVAKGRPVKSTAPKKALPKAKLGMSMKGKKSC